jgi:hypothetical protein
MDINTWENINGKVVMQVFRVDFVEVAFHLGDRVGKSLKAADPKKEEISRGQIDPDGPKSRS